MPLNLPSILTNAVKIAHTATISLQQNTAREGIVTHYAWIGADAFGKPTYAAPIKRRAIYESKHESKFDTNTGSVVQVKGTLIFLEAISPNGTAGRTEPIDNRDLIILPDGTSGPIFKPEGLYNPVAGRPFLIELWIGA
jgi:hypothetical protein